ISDIARYVDAEIARIKRKEPFDAFHDLTQEMADPASGVLYRCHFSLVGINVFDHFRDRRITDIEVLHGYLVQQARYDAGGRFFDDLERHHAALACDHFSVRTEIQLAAARLDAHLHRLVGQEPLHQRV